MNKILTSVFCAVLASYTFVDNASAQHAPKIGRSPKIAIKPMIAPPPKVAVNLKPLVCRGASGHSKLLSMSAAQALLQAGYKNFKVTVSSIPAGREAAKQPFFDYNLGDFKVEKSLIGCEQSGSSAACKTGVKIKFIGATPKELESCSIDKKFTFTTLLPGGRNVVTEQTITLPGAYVSSVKENKESAVDNK